MILKIVTIISIAACIGCAGEQELTSEQIAFYGDVPSTSAKYRSVQRPVPIGNVNAQEISSEVDTEATAFDEEGTAVCIGDPFQAPSAYTPKYDNNESYGDSLDADLPSTSLTGDYDYNYSADSDDDPNFSKPSNGYGSSKSDPSPIQPKTGRLPSLR